MTVNDLELLEEYLRHKSEKAFATLVNRHLNLVYSAALRQVRSPQLAEEVAQSVFTDLSRNARQLKHGTILTAWLYQVTRRTAIDVVRRESRRQARERLAAEMAPMNTVAEWTHIEPFLDEAMAALDETDRVAILLRFFENKSLREVGATLGTSDDAAQKRVSRAVERLREFFTKRGVTIGAGGLVALVTANAVQAAPAGLAGAISTAAIVGGTTIAATSTVTLTKAIAMTTLQKTLLAATIAVAAGAGIYEAHQSSNLRDQIQSLQQQQDKRLQLLEAERDEASGKLANLQAENEKLNQNTSELLKLRSDVGRLRKEAEAAALANRHSALAQATPPTGDPATNSPSFQTYSAKVRVNVPWNQAVITGGWKLPSGQRGLIITTPVHTVEPGSVELQTKILSLTEDCAGKLGLDKFNTDSREVTSSTTLTTDQYKTLMNVLDRSDGVDALAAPVITTESGRQAQVSVVDDPATASGETHAPGPVVDYMPIISPDGQSIDLQIIANLNYPASAAVK
jgi:RNA polymerase sigma factor (sigma-70 family)